MKRKFATVLSTMSAFAFLAGNAAAHPGHSPVDVEAQLAAPLAGPDHLLVFISAGAFALLGVSRLALYLVERRKAAVRR